MKNKIISTVVLCILGIVGGFAQESVGINAPDGYVTNSLWDNWFIQAGMGMSLLNRYGENVGVQYEFGPNIWYNPHVLPTASSTITGHNWPRFIVNTMASVGVGFGAKTILKKAIKEERPDHSDNKSFPSGHATMAFAAARSLDKEFRHESIWIPIAGYTAATAIGIERVANKRHHWYDVVAGAALGIGSAELTWWLSDKLLGTGSNIAVGTSVNTVDVAIGL